MERLLNALRGARSTFVLTGAGMSAESGLPTFRGAGGYWRQRRFEDLASPQGFARDPQLVWQWYNERLAAYAGAQPNEGHVALAQLERRLNDFTLATQNVDSLHQRAGSRNVLELHGDLRRARCSGCGEIRELAGGFPLEAIEHDCGGRFRPNVVWFGEALPAGTWEGASDAASRADVILVVGTSAQVYPAASLAAPMNGRAFVAEINPDATGLSQNCDLTLRETAAKALPAIVATL